MDLIKCEACSNEISKTAKECPKCGHPNKNSLEKKSEQAAGLVVLFVILFVLIAVFSGDDKPEDEKVVATTPKISPEQIIEFSGVNIACLTTEALAKLGGHAYRLEETKFYAMINDGTNMFAPCVQLSTTIKYKVLSANYDSVLSTDPLLEIVTTEMTDSTGFFIRPPVENIKISNPEN